ncbi:MAG: (4Fe-4S)-binding protein [Prolixibacteraceae bacterium]|nr:(4Fe-4S)-binding protein [Prolixibacteraceae bacterium]
MSTKGDKWGFQPEKSNVIVLDRPVAPLYRQLRLKVPSLASCFFCGGCSATCTASEEGMNFRVVHLLLCRGEMEKVASLIAPCLLCGKCTLVCPRNVDARSVVFNLKLALHELQ